jgi:hypothetical protein
MASEPPTGEQRRTSVAAVGAAITGALVLGATVVWNALEIAALLAFEGATTAGAAYALVRHRRRLRRSTG